MKNTAKKTALTATLALLTAASVVTGSLFETPAALLPEDGAPSIVYNMNTGLDGAEDDDAGASEDESEEKRQRGGIRAMTIVSFLYCGCGFLINYFAGNAVAQLFIDASQTAILADVHRYLVSVGSFYPTLAVIFIFRNGLQGMGFSRQAMLAGVSELVARALVAFCLVGSLGFQAVCFANPTAWVFADVILLALYRKEIRRLDSEPALLLRYMRADALKFKRAAVK